MSCVHQFGIIKEFDKNKEYSAYEPDICEKIVSVDDDIVSLWYFDTMNMICYTGNTTKLSKGINMCGATVIPPDSLYRLIEIVERRTPRDKQEDTDELIRLITSAIRQDKYMIHYGV